MIPKLLIASLQILSLIIGISCFHPSNIFIKSQFKTTVKSTVGEIQDDTSFMPPDPLNQFGISDRDCADASSKMRRIVVPVPNSVSSSGEVGLSYIHWPKNPSAEKKNLLPLLLIHGFDSSALEYRRLGPQLATLGIDVYGIDLLGWGFTQLPSSAEDNSINYSAESKIEAIKAFWKVVGNDAPAAICGASLGGAAVIELATSYSSSMKACILIDAQGFIDGIGPVVSLLPPPLAKLGISVLKSTWLRSTANQMSYFDKETFATEDALKVGRIHCLNDGWADSMLSFMTSGGFKPKSKVELVQQPTCVIWGRNDEILDGNEFANKFMETLPNPKNELNWIEECGHVPHLEKPKETAKTIYDFLSKHSN